VRGGLSTMKGFAGGSITRDEAARGEKRPKREGVVICPLRPKCLRTAEGKGGVWRRPQGGKCVERLRPWQKVSLEKGCGAGGRNRRRIPHPNKRLPLISRETTANGGVLIRGGRPRGGGGTFRGDLLTFCLLAWKTLNGKEVARRRRKGKRPLSRCSPVRFEWSGRTFHFRKKGHFLLIVGKRGGREALKRERGGGGIYPESERIDRGLSAGKSPVTRGR